MELESTIKEVNMETLKLKIVHSQRKDHRLQAIIIDLSHRWRN
jgi:hypothetical protein